MFGEMTLRERVAWVAIVAIGVAARVIAVDRWPGINGDESWYGVNVQEFLHGGAAFLKTGVGNPLNPIHSGLLLPLLAVFPPWPALLRVPEVILGILTVVLAFPMTVRAVGSRAALIFTALVAVAPAAVMYARLGWDPSGTPLVTLLVLALALSDRPVHAIVALVAAILVHPTNVFVIPIAAAVWTPHAFTRLRGATSSQRARVLLIAVALLAVGGTIAALLLIRAAGNPNTSLPSIAMLKARVLSPAAWISLMRGALALVSGVTSATYIAGPMPRIASQLATGITALGLLLPIAIGFRSFLARRTALWLIAGLVVSLAAFLVVAGPDAMRPGVERYALFLLVPALLLGSIALAALSEFRAGLAAIAFVLVSASMMAVLGGGYFYPLATTGGESVSTYRTGITEPKLAAFAFIERDTAGGRATVIADDWWIYWTLRYFAGAGGRIAVEPATGVEIPGGIRPRGAPPAKPRIDNQKYEVTFAGTQTDATLSRLGRAAFTATDPLDRPILRVYRLIP